MGSIRPLLTIAILAGVGAYLYVKINEGPAPSRAAANSANQGPDGVPPVTGAKGTTLAADNAAPAWPSSTPPAASTPSATAAPSAKALAKDGMPAVPAIPELPPLPSINDPAPPATPTTTPPPLPNDLPANIPVATYPDQPGKSPSGAASKDAALQPAPLSTTDPKKAAASAPAPGASATAPPITPASPALNSPNSAAPTSPSPQSSVDNNPLRPAAPAAPASDDRYANPPPTGPISLIGKEGPTTFAASWPAIQAALDKRDLKQAHQLLSKWHGNDTLSPADSAKVETLLSQLAGTVIYSTEHQLEPARMVKPGETLDAIAKEYNVTPQLLAKINGVPATGLLQPGQQLKVVRGPFAAVIDVRHNELTLTVDDRYAGKFPVTVPPGTALTDGQWLVDQKLAGKAGPSAYTTTPVPADRSLVLRSATANAPAGTATLVIASRDSQMSVASNIPSVRVSPQDAEEISDILSVGSRVVVRK